MSIIPTLTLYYHLFWFYFSNYLPKIKSYIKLIKFHFNSYLHAFCFHIMIYFCFSIFIISLWQLCLLLFSVQSRIKSSSVYLDKNRPLIYGPIVFSFTFWTKSPSMFRIPKHPSSMTDLNSNRAVISKLDSDTQTEVGPNLPLNWWKTLS